MSFSTQTIYTTTIATSQQKLQTAVTATSIDFVFASQQQQHQNQQTSSRKRPETNLLQLLQNAEQETIANRGTLLLTQDSWRNTLLKFTFSPPCIFFVTTFLLRSDYFQTSPHFGTSIYYILPSPMPIYTPLL
jgi:hypothetical protein